MAFSLLKIGTSTAIILSMIVSVSPAFADRGHYRGHYNQYSYDDYQDRRDYRDYRRDYRRDRRDDRRDYNYRNNRCDKGTGGTIIGAIAGGLLGNEIVGRRGDKTAGVIIGAGVGALAGRAIDRSDGRRC